MSRSAARSGRRWEIKVASDLGLIRILRESYSEAAPDTVEVQIDPCDMPRRPYWDVIQHFELGPLLGECKSRKHGAIPHYVIRAVREGEPHIKRAIPEEIKQWVLQAKRYKIDVVPYLRFVAISKKAGKGKGNGPCRFVICDRGEYLLLFGKPASGTFWLHLVLIPYDEFVTQVQEWRKSNVVSV